ncbi:hypothetical protein [Commensalibacter papalotli (ex Botero et al. 2024)]|uniref:DUF4426 domain-containing protein n=1 Tax=Commensalibacter papalotli (ex Botero et al. 2024) TaxID=2972766 RepID=A0ABM9HIV8_9PROT|nr:hypothetical protein [Commensalibacter papalotli (ex Botero et al. 2024)]CAI3925770.1 unnamed protein product [Commensalibacter papalotli (ex Botero et al. 2024)]CAI3926284.1 unnamed protein product [Commensalibacter papalotli (ex Botero et al. 2024)]
MSLYKSFFILTLALNPFPIAVYAQDIVTSPLAIRALQTREFTGINQAQALSIGIATFQDLGFIITESSASLGLIKANQTRPDENTIIQATLTLVLNPGKEAKITCRLSLSYSPFYYGEEGANLAGQPPRQSSTVQSPILYQQFFNAFSYSIHINKT